LVIAYTKILEGSDAIDLWLEGKDEWNKWVKENRVANVSFAGVDFSQYKVTENSILFEEYNFPRGKVDFSKANFGNGEVSFSKAVFLEGNINFNSANFGEGSVNFRETTFGKCKVSFREASFGKGNISFRGASFGDGNISFQKVSFGDGNVDIHHANFGEGGVNFREATFRDGEIIFTETTFKGKVDFSKANFEKCKVFFHHASFGKGNVIFREATFGEGQVFFENCTFYGNAEFSNLRACDAVTLFSFRNVSFEKTFTISGHFSCVVDMVGTKTSHHVELSGLICRLERKPHWILLEKANDEKDAARLRRLKELAEMNKHHEAGLRFHADEMRAKRWHETGKLASILDMLFSTVSNYGQSILRPAMGLVALTLLASIFPAIDLPIENETLKSALSNSLPFLPASRALESSIASVLHQLFAFIFIFLIGLGLRNRFRV
jgi:uncharacterized protein YjbI with pentapeptide repeats